MRVGVAGVVNAEALQRMRRSLAHRGPDGQGKWLSPRGEVGFVHTRLSIVDLETGAQPLLNEDGSVCAVVNGEFYDFERIRRGLLQRGHRLSTSSDSEVLLHLYEERGFDCVHELRGEFAFCLWDELKRTLWAVRDRFGIKPLYYAVQGTTVLLASEIKALFAAGVTARWDTEATLGQLFVSLPDDRTPYRGIQQVPPGHMLISEAQGIRLQKYWEMEYPASDSELLQQPEEEYIEQLRSALDEAVRLRLRADVPVGCFLSGGLDSSSVLGIAARHASAPIHAYTVCFEDSAYDERRYAEHMARFAGGVFVPTPVRQTDLAAHFREALWHGEMFALNGHGVARFIHSKAVHEAGCKVVLSGSGSDDLLGGYPTARLDTLLRDRRQSDRSGGLAPFGSGSPVLAGVQQRLGFTPSWLSKLALDRSVFFLLFRPELLQLFEKRNPYDQFVDSAMEGGGVAGCDTVIQSLFLWTRAFLGGYELLAERLEMAHGLEVRLPFLDHHLFEVIRRIPASLLVKAQQEKYVLRQAARPFLPDLIYRRSKHSFTSPPITLDPRSEFHQLLQDSLRASAFRDVPFFDSDAVIELLDRLPNCEESLKLSLDGVMMLILSAALLQQSYSVAA